MVRVCTRIVHTREDPNAAMSNREMWHSVVREVSANAEDDDDDAHVSFYHQFKYKL